MSCTDSRYIIVTVSGCDWWTCRVWSGTWNGNRKRDLHRDAFWIPNPPGGASATFRKVLRKTSRSWEKFGLWVGMSQGCGQNKRQTLHQSWRSRSNWVCNPFLSNSLKCIKKSVIALSDITSDIADTSLTFSVNGPLVLQRDTITCDKRYAPLHKQKTVLCEIVQNPRRYHSRWSNPTGPRE